VKTTRCAARVRIRVRGLYSLKDSFVSGALSADPPAPVTWIEEQTGVAYATLRRHYARWWPSADAGSPFDHFGPANRASNAAPKGTITKDHGDSGPYGVRKGGFVTGTLGGVSQVPVLAPEGPDRELRQGVRLVGPLALSDHQRAAVTVTILPIYSRPREAVSPPTMRSRQ